MRPALRWTIVAALTLALVVLVACGQALLGEGSGAVVMVLTFAAGFAWLWFVVAPWAARGRAKRGP